MTRMDDHLRCSRCGYNLHGLVVGSACPECAQPAQASLGARELRFASTEYLESVSSGILVHCASIAALFVFNVARIFGLMAGQADFLLGNGFLEWFELVLTTGGVVGFFLLTVPDPNLAGTEALLGNRRVCRVLAAAALCGSVAKLLFVATAVDRAGLFMAVALQMLAWPTVLLTPFIYSLDYIDALYRRVPSDAGVATVRQYWWLLPLLTIAGMPVLVGPLIAVYLYVRSLRRLQSHIKDILDARRQL